MAREYKKQGGIFERPKGLAFGGFVTPMPIARCTEKKWGCAKQRSTFTSFGRPRFGLGSLFLKMSQSSTRLTSVAEIIDDYLKASEAMMRKSIDDIRQRAGW
jgi:hypothetical protein